MIQGKDHSLLIQNDGFLYAIPIHMFSILLVLIPLAQCPLLPSQPPSCRSSSFFDMFLSSASMSCAFLYPPCLLPRALPLLFIIPQHTHFIKLTLINCFQPGHNFPSLPPSSPPSSSLQPPLISIVDS